MAAGAEFSVQGRDPSADFLAAGSSALLLSFAHVYGELWFILLFALVPFLWRLCCVSLTGAASLGIMLATFFVCATSVRDLILTPDIFLLKLFALNAAFVVFALIINRARRHLGFDPLFIALLWLPLEYALIHFAGLGDIFSISNSGCSLVIGFCSLFGILLGSLVVILGNSLLLLIIRYLRQWMLSRTRLSTECNKKARSPVDEILLERRWYYFPDVRAPPRCVRKCC